MEEAQTPRGASMEICRQALSKATLFLACWQKLGFQICPSVCVSYLKCYTVGGVHRSGRGGGGEPRAHIPDLRYDESRATCH